MQAGRGGHRDGRTHRHHEHEPVRCPWHPRAAHRRGRPPPGTPPVEAALRGAREQLAAAERALVGMHWALEAAVAELATTPDPSSTPDTLTTVQLPKMRKLARSLDLSVVHCKRNRNTLPRNFEFKSRVSVSSMSLSEDLETGTILG